MKRWFLLLILLTPAMARGQEVCVPQPLPWFEDFETGFTWENGWINTSLDTTDYLIKVIQGLKQSMAKLKVHG